MNEAGVWNTLKTALNGRCLTTRIESSAGNGVPDVVVHLPKKHAFIELKHIPSWPSRLSTVVHLPLRSEQRLWIHTRGGLSGNCWVFIRVADDFFLFPWDVALHVHDVGFRRTEWLKYPFHWVKKLDGARIVEILKGGDNATKEQICEPLS